MDAHIPRSLGDDDRANAHTPTPEGVSSRESRDFIADSAHLIARGRNADVYLLNDTQVLRRLHTGAPDYPDVRFLRHLNALGFPTARVIEVDGTDLVMERLHGPNMFQALDAGEVTIAEGVHILLDLHATLHALPLPVYAQDGAGLTEAAGIVAAPRGVCMLHLDLHPGNVLLTATGPQVIDWELARLGSAGVDLATTALVFAEVVVDGNEYAGAALRMLRRFAEAAGAGFGAYLAEAAAVRGSQTNLDPVERVLLPQASIVVEHELQRVGG